MFEATSKTNENNLNFLGLFYYFPSSPMAGFVLVLIWVRRLQNPAFLI